MTMQRILSSRHSTSCESLLDAITRVAQTVAKNDTSLIKYVDLMSRGHFLPAGRTLLTSDAKAQSVVPNCAVVPPDPVVYNALMPLTIGLGSNLNHVTGVVERMRELGRIPVADGTGRKPGIMQTLKWSHPEAQEFVSCKQGVTACSPLFNMNISVIVPRDEYFKFRKSSLFESVVLNAMQTGDPGILMPASGENSDIATSPCGELWMNPFEVCTLGNLNLANFIDCEGNVKLRELADATFTSIEFLNDVVDRLVLPLEEMKVATHKHRRVGLGVMGFADALKKCGLRYGSRESFDVGCKMAGVMRMVADELGPIYKNATVLALAPTGGTAALMNASYSLEPYFHEMLTISPRKQVWMVSAWQQFTDNAISKTVNLPRGSSFETVAGIFDYAFECRLRGITVYVDGSRELQPQECSVC